MKTTAAMNSPVGRLFLASEDGFLTDVSFVPVMNAAAGDDPVLRRAEEQLRAYFAGELREFTLPLRLTGTEFQKKVWDALRRIPFGKTRTYGELAAEAGCPRAARAVGGACNRNPAAIIVPCHRVVGAGGNLTGYAGGLGIKAWLLQHEGIG